MGQRENLYLLAEDLGERKLQDVLRAKALWDYGVPAVIIAEGLVMYLPPPKLSGDCFAGVMQSLAKKAE